MFSYLLAISTVLLAPLTLEALAPPHPSRRKFMAALVISASGVATEKAGAVTPLAEADLKHIDKTFWSAKLPNDKLSRQKLALDFAVLLTRSTYAEADQLDIIPVNQLERDMYLVRTTEFLPYSQRVGSLMQGDLTDPKYFDYMSAVQHVIVNRALEDPETTFYELQPEDKEMFAGKLESVRVERKIPDRMLVPTHDERVGTSILDYINDTYSKTAIALPTYDSLRPGSDAVLQTLSQLVNLFLINGFCWEGKAELLKEKASKSSGSGMEATFRLTLQAPATLWSGRVLAKSGAPLRNDFLLKTAKQVVRSMGYTVQSSSVTIKGDEEVSLLTIV